MKKLILFAVLMTLAPHMAFADAASDKAARDAECVKEIAKMYEDQKDSIAAKRAESNAKAKEILDRIMGLPPK